MRPVVPVARRLPARPCDDGRDSGTGLRLAALTSASADYAACCSSVDSSTVLRRHVPPLAMLLADSLPRLARMPILPPITTPFAAEPHAQGCADLANTTAWPAFASLHSHRSRSCRWYRSFRARAVRYS